MELKDLVGEHRLTAAARTDVRHPFNSDREGIAWHMDGKVFMVFEDHNDGYRSAAGPILVASGEAYEFWDPDYLRDGSAPGLAGLGVDVVGRYIAHDEAGEADLLELVDVSSGHVWLRVGTQNIDDYYPWFVAEWHPKPQEADPNA